MAKDFYIDFIKQLLQKAEIEINGSNPWDIRVYNESFYKQVFRKGSLGLGESYMEGIWDCKQLDECMFRIISSNLADFIKLNFKKTLYLVEAMTVH